jgi:hypothetical protein
VRTVSLHAALRELGLPIPALAITALVGLAGGIIVHRHGRDLGVAKLSYLSFVLSLGMLPVISNGSLSLGIPVVVGAVGLAIRRSGQRWGQGAEPRRRAILDMLLVFVGTVVFCGGDAWSLWPEAPPSLRGLTMAAPLLALGGLTHFCLKSHSEPPPSSPR